MSQDTDEKTGAATSGKALTVGCIERWAGKVRDIAGKQGQSLVGAPATPRSFRKKTAITKPPIWSKGIRYSVSQNLGCRD